VATAAKILVLDDEDDTQDLFLQKFRHQITDKSYEFSFTNRSEDTLNLLQQQAFDVFVSDINVAGMDGISFIAQLRRE
jgi:CheY-like chemotaxis protein